MKKRKIALNIVEDILRLIVIALMVICLYDMPHVYYVSMRIFVCLTFVHFAIRNFVEQNGCLGYICAAAALTFEPIYHLSLGWVIWDLVDIIVIIIMVYMGIRAFRENHTKRQLRYHKDEDTETPEK